jgi:DNA-binding ferritin-like protein (Dps family)
MGADYSKASEATYDLFRQVAHKYKPAIADAVSFELLMRNDGEATWTSQGKTVGARIQKVPAIWREFLSADFVIVINEKLWKNAEATVDWKRALLHHELCHLRINTDTEVVELIGHDVEEFLEIVRVHGAWTPALNQFGRELKQLALPFMAPAEEAA